jgi:hypothetical protein
MQWNNHLMSTLSKKKCLRKKCTNFKIHYNSELFKIKTKYMDGIMGAIIEIITLNNEISHNYRKNLITNSI